ncbi:MAG: hypothetical protein MR270_04290 [Erysipelotrichaceae bacterium]|nr:hypothetical protein [Erysipelotrichaceae bacterium]
MDNEIYKSVEFQKTDEYQSFPAERFHVKEIKSDNIETFKSNEFSSSNANTSNNNSNKMSFDEQKKLAQMSSSTSKAISSSMSLTATISATTTSVIVTASSVFFVASLGIIPIKGLTQEHVESTPIVEEITPDEGLIDFKNYKVNYYFNDTYDDVIYDITFYFEGDISDDYSYKIIDNSSNQETYINNNMASFENLENGDREFTFTIYNNDNIVQEKTILVENNYVENAQVDLAYKVTYNQDNSSNLYTYTTPLYEGEYITYINIFDENGNLLNDYNTINDGALSSVLNIKESNYFAYFDTYYIKDNNYYSYGSSEKIVIDSNFFFFDCQVNDNVLSLYFDNDLSGDINVKVTHDDLSIEEFIVPSDELIDNSYSLTLNKISFNPTIEIVAQASFHNYDENNLITDTIGSIYKEFSEQKNVLSVVSSNINLSRFEIFNTSYNLNYDDTSHAPIFMYFDGYLNEGDTYSIVVNNLNGEEVTSKNNLSLSNDPVIFYDLLADVEYTFNIYLNTNEGSKLIYETNKTLSIIEYNNLPYYYCLNPNPYDALITYNDDNTSNIYLYMDVQPTDYDMYYKVYLVDASIVDGTAFYECVSNENVAVFKNIPEGIYCFKYAVLINDNDTCYSVYDVGYPSGSIHVGLDENGNYPGSDYYINYDQSSKQLEINIFAILYDDVNITLISEDGTTINIDVLLSDINESSILLDLSSYGLLNFTVVVKGVASFMYGNGDVIKNEVTIEGSESCPFIIEHIIMNAEM